MGVVLAIGACATIVLRFWRWVNRSDEGKATMLSIKTAAATVGTLAGVIFDLIAALTNAKVTVHHTLLPSAPKPTLPPGLHFGSIGQQVAPGGTPG